MDTFLLDLHSAITTISDTVKRLNGETYKLTMTVIQCYSLFCLINDVDLANSRFICACFPNTFLMKQILKL